MGVWLWMALISAAGHLGAAEVPSRPTPTNVLFVLIDDMGYGDLSCFGNREIRTEAIDRLAKEGLRFTQFYVNAPICSPSRVALTTGQYPGRWNITSYLDSRQIDRRRHIADWLSSRAPSLARVLKEAGYYTAHVGKWHMGGQRDVGDAPPISAYGFDTSLTNFEGLGERVLPKFEPRSDGKALRHQPTDMSAELGGGPIHWVDRDKVSAFYADRAIQEMQAAQKLGKPFYINLWPDDVHSPVQAPAKLRGDGSPGAQYRGVLTELDRQLGRVFEYIRSQPSLRDNTLILLASDNGPEPGLGSAGGLRGNKANLYEGGIRSPLIVWWGSHIASDLRGSRNSQTVIAGMDVPPSLLSILKLESPSSIAFDGMNLGDALIGRNSPRRETPIMWVRPPDRPGPDNSWPDLAIREGQWKLLVFRDGSHAELFDIDADPQETKNLAAIHPEVSDRLSKQVRAWDKQVRSHSASKPADAAKPTAAPAASAGVRIERDLPYLEAGRKERLDLYLPAVGAQNARSPGIVIIHGGGWTGGDKGAAREINIGTTLAGAGYVCASVNYRLDKAGRWPTNLQDCKNAVRFLRKNAELYHVDPENIGVIGGSAGGHLALMVAYTSGISELEPSEPYGGVSSQVSAVVDLYGITDLLTRRKTDDSGKPVGPTTRSSELLEETADQNPSAWRMASPVTHVSARTPPTLILHGTKDTTVDRDQASELAARLKEQGVEYQLIWVEGIGHTFDLQTWAKKPLPADLRPVVISFFDKHLKRP